MLRDFPQLQLETLKPLDTRSDLELDLIGGESQKRKKIVTYFIFKYIHTKVGSSVNILV
jgi:hypothetical protein